MISRRSILASPLLCFPAIGSSLAFGDEPQDPKDPRIITDTVKHRRGIPLPDELPDLNVTDDMVVKFSAIINNEVQFVGRSVDFSLTPTARKIPGAQKIELVSLAPAIDLTNIANYPVGDIPLAVAPPGSNGSSYFRLEIPVLHVLIPEDKDRVPRFFRAQGTKQLVSQALVTLPKGIELRFTRLIRVRDEQQAAFQNGYVFGKFVVEAHTVSREK